MIRHRKIKQWYLILHLILLPSMFLIGTTCSDFHMIDKDVINAIEIAIAVVLFGINLVMYLFIFVDEQ